MYLPADIVRPLWGDESASVTLRCGGSLMTITRPLVMGIVNVTPDSFYADSRTPDGDSLENRIAAMIEDGADIIDIGGYSTRPGADVITAEEEWSRVKRALEVTCRVAGEDTVISVDTFRAEIARRSVTEFGVNIINDISGGDMDPDMYGTVADLKVAYVLMHTRGTPATMQSLAGYQDVVAEVFSDLLFKVDRLHDMGVADIILDPGFGFAKTVEDNFELLEHLQIFTRSGLPVLVGLSRKSMIWRTLGTTPAESLGGTIALNMAALERGASILRVHDIKAARETIELYLKMHHI